MDTNTTEQLLVNYNIIKSKQTTVVFSAESAK